MVVDKHMAVLDIRIGPRASRRNLDEVVQQLKLELEFSAMSQCQWLFLYLTFCLSGRDRIHYRQRYVHDSEEERQNCQIHRIDR